MKPLTDRMVHLYTVRRWSYQRIADALGVTKGVVAGEFNRLRARETGSKARRALLSADPRKAPDGRDGDFYIPGPPQGAIRDHAVRPLPDPGANEILSPDPIRFTDIDGDLRCRFPIGGAGRDLVCCGGAVARPGAEGKSGIYCGHHVHASSRGSSALTPHAPSALAPGGAGEKSPGGRSPACMNGGNGERS
ncbi:hypothetical protein [Hoeflea sp. TYP-13]|uniref:hypothetical protein n=1 Tax=Hoeflea sp. TYP-13 TaxID=3230023 RepID=UPI0034C6C7CF